MKKTKQGKPIELPTVEQLENELRRERFRRNYNRVLRSTLFTLISVAAVAILVAMLFMPVLQIYGSSMSPSLEDGEIVVTVKRGDFQQGDVISFYYNNKILVKRIIAFPGDWVDLDADGNVFVNGQKLEEPYLADKAYGDVNIELPYQVPDGKIFVMGDHRSTSADSRNTAIGCVAEEQIVGKMLLRVWPLSVFGPIE
ncbi:MAG: signal peptidase I [Clostridiales bacterium]|nr:signal peptidase I [Clostridiales bacterium]